MVSVPLAAVVTEQARCHYIKWMLTGIPLFASSVSNLHSAVPCSPLRVSILPQLLSCLVGCSKTKTLRFCTLGQGFICEFPRWNSTTALSCQEFSFQYYVGINILLKLSTSHAVSQSSLTFMEVRLCMQ